MIATPRAGSRSARRLAALLLAPILTLALAGCSDPAGEAADGPPPNPLLYEIASADGAVEGWMLGTIHALPPGTRWRTPAIERVVEDADLLVVEIAELGDSAGLSRIFASLATSPNLPPLDQRLLANQRPALAALLTRGDMELADFRQTETWAAALALARVDAEGDPANGVDRAVIADFPGRPVRELEGARAQLAIFDRLPEADQRALLAAVISDVERARADPARLQRAWLAGDGATIEQSTRSGILADPNLRAALLVERNQSWAAVLVPLLEQPARPLIAVGTAHLVGPEGLVALLEVQGYRVQQLSRP